MWNPHLFVDLQTPVEVLSSNQTLEIHVYYEVLLNSLFIRPGRVNWNYITIRSNEEYNLKVVRMFIIAAPGAYPSEKWRHEARRNTNNYEEQTISQSFSHQDTFKVSFKNKHKKTLDLLRFKSKPNLWLCAEVKRKRSSLPAYIRELGNLTWDQSACYTSRSTTHAPKQHPHH